MAHTGYHDWNTVRTVLVDAVSVVDCTNVVDFGSSVVSRQKVAYSALRKADSVRVSVARSCSYL